MVKLRISLLVAITFIVYAARMFWLISRYAVNIFFADQWDFNNATLFQRHSLWEMFRWQHGPHRQGVGALFERMVDPLFRWNSRTESFVIGGVIVVAAICALWLKKRLYGDLSVFDVVIPAILFTPALWQTLFMTQNFAHGPFPLLLVLLYFISWTCRRPALRYALVLFLNFITIYTGFGLFLGVLTPVLLILDYWTSTPQNRLLKAYFISTVFVSALSLASFFFGYTFQSGEKCFSFQPQSPLSYLAFVALMFANFFGIRHVAFSSQAIGTLIVIALLISLIMFARRLSAGKWADLGREDHNRAVIVVGLITFSLLFCANTAYGRLCGGLGVALQSRYSIYLEPAVLGFYFFLLSLRHESRRFFLTGFLIAVVAASLNTDRGGMVFSRDVKQRWKTCYLQTEDIQGCNKSVGFPIYTVSPEQTRLTHLQEKLEYLKATHQNLYLDQKTP
ncbi:MAG: hypothetical protein ACRD3P_06665 [Terriglobales bacterium]